MEETKAQKVMRMLAIRQMVRDHIFKGKRENVAHLGELDLDKADNTRMIIALQDLVEMLAEKKKRAEEHIAHTRIMLRAYAEGINKYGGEIVTLRERLYGKTSENEALTKQNQILQADLDKANRQLAVFKELFVDASKKQDAPIFPAEMPATKGTATGRMTSMSPNFWDMPLGGRGKRGLFS